MPSEAQRQSLLTACAYAKVFLEAADEELRFGSSERRREAADQLTAALRDISPCRTCQHMFIRHDGDVGGFCMDCPCEEFWACPTVSR